MLRYGWWVGCGWPGWPGVGCCGSPGPGGWVGVSGWPGVGSCGSPGPGGWVGASLMAHFYSSASAHARRSRQRTSTVGRNGGTSSTTPIAATTCSAACRQRPYRERRDSLLTVGHDRLSLGVNRGDRRGAVRVTGPTPTDVLDRMAEARRPVRGRARRRTLREACEITVLALMDALEDPRRTALPPTPCVGCSLTLDRTSLMCCWSRSRPPSPTACWRASAALA
jgi:hypothetical protein